MKWVPNKRLYLLFGDQRILKPIEEKLMDQEIPFEWYDEESGFQEWLRRQKMGCYLYGAADWEMIERLKPIAEEVGFSDEEMQWIGVGIEKKQVFCSKCHTIQPSGDRSHFNCTCCGLSLSVSDHYSAYHRAYLGYPF